MISNRSKRDDFDLLSADLKLERLSFEKTWKQLSDYILPLRARFTLTEANRGERKNQNIIDSTGTIAARTLQSGLMSGVTSPARPWFRLTTPDPAMAELPQVKEWLYTVGQRMLLVFTKSNLYQSLPVLYGDIGTFATGTMIVDEDPRTVMRFTPLPIGSYWLSTNNHNRVDVFYREFRMTIRQVIDEFAEKNLKNEVTNWDNLSTTVKSMFDAKRMDVWIDVAHVIRPNPDYDPRKLQAKFKKYESVYYEIGSASTYNGDYLGSIERDRYLRESGYDLFPVLAPRWEVTGEDIYGTNCPGIMAIGDIKALQTLQKRLAQAIEKMINPPMTGPVSMRNAAASILPGKITWADVREGMQGFRPVHEINPPIAAMLQYIQDHQHRIDRAFFSDLFLMMAESDRREITAREIDERHEEKLLALGPVLEQLNQDLLDPLIDIAFDKMWKQRMIPPPPQELQGIPLRVEYISYVAQAQKLISIGGIERFASFAGQVAQVNPEALDKVNVDELLDVYSDFTSIPPGIVRSDDEVAAIRAQRQQAQASQAKLAALQQGAGAAKDLSQADTSGQNALTELMNQGKAGSLIQ